MYRRKKRYFNRYVSGLLAVFILFTTVCHPMTSYAVTSGQPELSATPSEADYIPMYEGFSSDTDDEFDAGDYADITLDDFVNYRYDTYTPDELKELEGELSPETFSVSLRSADIPMLAAEGGSTTVSPVAVLAALLQESGMDVSRDIVYGFYDYFRDAMRSSYATVNVLTAMYINAKNEYEVVSLKRSEVRAVSDFLDHGVPVDSSSGTMKASVPCAIVPALQYYLSSLSQYAPSRDWFESVVDHTTTPPISADYSYSFYYFNSRYRTSISRVFMKKPALCGMLSSFNSYSSGNGAASVELYTKSLNLPEAEKITDFIEIEYAYDSTTELFKYYTTRKNKYISAMPGSLSLPCFNNLGAISNYCNNGILPPLRTGMTNLIGGNNLDQIVSLGDTSRFINWSGPSDVDDVLASSVSGFGFLNSDQIIKYQYDTFNDCIIPYWEKNARTFIDSYMSPVYLNRFLTHEKFRNLYMNNTLPPGTVAMVPGHYSGDTYFGGVKYYWITNYDPTHIYKLYFSESGTNGYAYVYDVTAGRKVTNLTCTNFYFSYNSMTDPSFSERTGYDGSFGLSKSHEPLGRYFFVDKVYPSLADLLVSSGGGITGDGSGSVTAQASYNRLKYVLQALAAYYGAESVDSAVLDNFIIDFYGNYVGGSSAEKEEQAEEELNKFVVINGGSSPNDDDDNNKFKVDKKLASGLLSFLVSAGILVEVGDIVIDNGTKISDNIQIAGSSGTGGDSGTDPGTNTEYQNSVKTFLNNIVTGITNLPANIATAIRAILYTPLEIATAIAEKLGLTGLFNTVVNAIKNIPGQIEDILHSPAEFVQAFDLPNLFQQLKSWLASIPIEITGGVTLGNILTEFQEFVQAMPGRIAQALGLDELFEAMPGSLTEAFNLPVLFGNIQNSLNEFKTAVIEALTAPSEVPPEKDSDSGGKKLMQLLIALIVILIMLLAIFINVLRLIIVIFHVPASTTLLNEYVLQGLEYLDTLIIPGFGISIKQLLYGIVYFLVFMSIIKMLRRYIDHIKLS